MFFNRMSSDAMESRLVIMPEYRKSFGQKVYAGVCIKVSESCLRGTQGAIRLARGVSPSVELVDEGKIINVTLTSLIDFINRVVEVSQDKNVKSISKFRAVVFGVDSTKVQDVFLRCCMILNQDEKLTRLVKGL